MAKGLRASSKVKARNARRYTPGSDYEVTHAARLHAISQRLMSRVKGKRSADADEDEGKQANGQQATVKVDDKQGAATAEDGKDQSATAMDTETPADGEAPQSKISTSGTRESRRETWRKARGWKAKIGSKNGGRPKRRR